VEPRGVAQEPISSELALVDGELARRARAALPDPPWLLPVLAELQEAERAEPPRRSRASRLPAVALAVLLLLMLAALASSFLPSQSPTLVTGPARRAALPAQTRSTPAGAPKRPAKRSEVRRAAKTKPAPPAAGAPAKPLRPKPKPAAKQSARPKPRTRTLRKAERVLRWRRYPPAAYYVLYLRRGAATIYTARTTRLTATLPARLKLGPGTYRVFVRPAVAVEAGIVFGPAVVEKTIKV
jgi:hypothetical protein